VNQDNQISQAQLEQIESYLQNNMSEENRAAFEEKLASDEHFRILFEDTKKLILGIETASLKDNLEAFHDEMTGVKRLKTRFGANHPKNKTKSFPWTRVKWYAAASILLILGTFWFQQDPSNSEALYAKHFVPDPGLATTMGSTQNYEFYKAMVQYKQGDYDKAIENWEAFENTGKMTDTLHYFIGVAYLANGDQYKAIKYLQPLQEEAQNPFQKETAYYLGLAYLKADNVEDAKKYLTFSGTVSAQKILSELID